MFYDTKSETIQYKLELIWIPNCWITDLGRKLVSKVRKMMIIRNNLHWICRSCQKRNKTTNWRMNWKMRNMRLRRNIQCLLYIKLWPSYEDWWWRYVKSMFVGCNVKTWKDKYYLWFCIRYISYFILHIAYSYVFDLFVLSLLFYIIYWFIWLGLTWYKVSKKIELFLFVSDAYFFSTFLLCFYFFFCIILFYFSWLLCFLRWYFLDILQMIISNNNEYMHLNTMNVCMLNWQLWPSKYIT